MKHYIKSWAHFFDAIQAGKKLHDLRKMDRDYNVGDILVLQRYDNINGHYTGEELEVEVTYITSNKVPCAFSSSALDRDYAILSLKLLQKPWVDAGFFLEVPEETKSVKQPEFRVSAPQGDKGYAFSLRPRESIHLNPIDYPESGNT